MSSMVGYDDCVNRRSSKVGPADSLVVEWMELFEISECFEQTKTTVIALLATC